MSKPQQHDDREAKSAPTPALSMLVTLLAKQAAREFFEAADTELLSSVTFNPEEKLA